MKTSKITNVLCLTLSAYSLWAGPQPKSPATNGKDHGSMKEYHQELKEEGWHRKAASRVTDELLHTFGDQVILPSPNLDEHLNRLIEDYQNRYTAFENNYSATKKYSKLKKGPSKKTGEWTHIVMNPTAGRIYDLELNPKNPQEMYANPDGDGIFFSKNRGVTWRSITDNITSRLHRDSYENIIVDPAHFNHVFSISHLGRLYQTKNGGQSWSYIKNSKNKEGRAPQFKWVEAFRTEKKKLVIIGSVKPGGGLNRGWQPGIYRSEDAGKSWDNIKINGAHFQEMAFHKTKSNVIYLGGKSKLFISYDAGKSFKLLKDFGPGDQPIFITTLSGKQANHLYAVVSNGGNTRLYFSNNCGKKWELRQDSVNKIGYNKGIFGNSGSSGWTSFFEVDPYDSDHLVASSVGSCESFDGGVTWEYQSWGTRAKAVMPDGTIAMSPHGGHNADNHVLKFHPLEKGFMVKGCDAGIMMKTKNSHDNWTNINGDMPAFLWYSLVVNEFGDRYIAGNTQDVNIQSFRYGIWENEKGYEGDAIYINPYTNVTYYPMAKTEKGEGLNFLEVGAWKMHSWNYPKTASNYSNPDQFFIAYGRRPQESKPQLPKYLYRTDDRGVTFSRVPNLDKKVYTLNISRTKKQLLTAFTDDGVMVTPDFGETWKSMNYPAYFKPAGGTRSVSGTVNPKNPMQMWVGSKNGKVIATNDQGQTWTDISGKLPKGQISELVFHEGSKGDLYALVNGFGVFYLAADQKDWVLWMDGFNLKDFREIRIDYPNQRLVAASYGRGLWEAPLMNPCDRFYNANFPIKQLGCSNGIKSFSIDSPWVTPDYYNYQWYCNKKRVGKNTPTLILKTCKSGDQITLKISPRYASSVKTFSRSIEVRESKRKLITTDDKPLKVTEGYLDLGIVEHFGAGQNFTFETYIKLDNAGVIAGNRRHFFRDAKGWFLNLDNKGEVSLYLSVRQNGAFSRTFGKPPEQALIIKSGVDKVKLNKWAHLAFTVDRKGDAILYIDGKKVGSIKMESKDANISLNSVLSTTLFADPIGMKRTTGEIMNVRIWDQVLTPNQLKLNRPKLKQTDGLVYYLNFNGTKNREQFTRRKVIVK